MTKNFSVLIEVIELYTQELKKQSNINIFEKNVYILNTM
jgi:hypothetical protein